MTCSTNSDSTRKAAKDMFKSDKIDSNYLKRIKNSSPPDLCLVLCGQMWPNKGVMVLGVKIIVFGVTEDKSVVKNVE